MIIAATSTSLYNQKEVKTATGFVTKLQMSPTDIEEFAIKLQAEITLQGNHANTSFDDCNRCAISRD